MKDELDVLAVVFCSLFTLLLPSSCVLDVSAVHNGVPSEAYLLFLVQILSFVQHYTCGSIQASPT